MDFSTISNKLKNGDYASRDEFAADFKLMVNNCYIYNQPTTPPFLDAQKLESLFDECTSSFLLADP